MGKSLKTSGKTGRQNVISKIYLANLPKLATLYSTTRDRRVLLAAISLIASSQVSCPVCTLLMESIRSPGLIRPSL